MCDYGFVCECSACGGQESVSLVELDSWVVVSHLMVCWALNSCHQEQYAP